MWTGRIAVVRSVTAAAAASGSRLSVTGSMSAKTGRARSNTQTFALATNENGDVTTSSPSDTPTARSPRCSPAVPLDTALACAALSREAKASSNAGTRGPSESWPERRTSMTAASSASPRTGLASGIGSRSTRAGTRARRAPGRARARRGPPRPAPGLLGELERVDERLPRRRDHVLVDADRAPHVLAVGGVDEHAGHRAGAVALVEDADLVVDELDVAQVRVDLGDRGAQGGVERVHRAVALGGADVALAVDPNLDRRLGLDLSVRALLDDHAPRLEREQRLVLAALAPHQQLERPVGRLEVVAAVLELLDAIDDPRRGGVVDGEPRRGRLLGRRPAPAQLRDQQLADVADAVGLDAFEGRGVGAHAGDGQSALVGEGVLAHVRLVGVGHEVEQLVDEVRDLGELLEAIGPDDVVAHLELEVGDDRDEVRVAGALADAVHRPLHLPRARVDGGQGVRHAALGVVVAVEPDAHAVAQRGDHGARRLGDLVRQRRAVRVAEADRVGARGRRGREAFERIG